MWQTPLLKHVAATPVCGYLAHDHAAAEPTALAALALATHDAEKASWRAAEWLAATQASDGSVAVRRDVDGPCWPTSLAVLAWQVVDRVAFADPIARGVAWMLSLRCVA